MESPLNRYRSFTVLVLVIFAQLILLAVQVKNDQNVSVIRSWTVTAVSPVARILEWGRHSSVGFIRNYVLLRDASEENRRLQSEVDRLKVENVFLTERTEPGRPRQGARILRRPRPLQDAGRHGVRFRRRLRFQRGSGGPRLRLGRGARHGRGNPRRHCGQGAQGLCHEFHGGPDQRSGLCRRRGHAERPGARRPQGTGKAHVQGGLRSLRGQDRRRGLVVHLRRRPHVSARLPRRRGEVREERAAIQGDLAEPSGLRRGVPEDVLIILEGVHQDIPEAAPSNQAVYINPSPPAAAQPEENASPAAVGTEADRARAQAKAISDSQGHAFGSADGKIPDFNAKNPLPPAPPPAEPPPAANSTRRANQAAGASSGGKQDR